ADRAFALALRVRVELQERIRLGAFGQDLGELRLEAEHVGGAEVLAVAARALGCVIHVGLVGDAHPDRDDVADLCGGTVLEGGPRSAVETLPAATTVARRVFLDCGWTTAPVSASAPDSEARARGVRVMPGISYTAVTISPRVTSSGLPRSPTRTIEPAVRLRRATRPARLEASAWTSLGTASLARRSTARSALCTVSPRLSARFSTATSTTST